MRILIDMNLSPRWCEVLRSHSHSCIHWSQIGSPQASDSSLMEYARDHGYTVLTHDLDFGAILAATHASGPSVIQIRTQDTLPPAMEKLLDAVLRQFAQELTAGALIVVEEGKSRVRVLPLFPRDR